MAPNSAPVPPGRPRRSGPQPPRSVAANRYRNRDERVGTADRNQVAEILLAATSEGYLDLTEYEDRVGRATSARTVSDLASLVADLPEQFRWHRSRRTKPQGGTDQSPSSIGYVGLAFGISSIPLSLCGGLGLIPGILAVVFGFTQFRLPEQHRVAMLTRALGIAGCVLSTLAVTVYLLWSVTIE